MKIQFIDADSDLLPTLIFTTHLGDQYASISSWVGNADYTYNTLNPNTAYDIEVTAVLEDGVLSRPWTLTATTLMESSDSILPIVVGCVVSGAVVGALSVVIGFILKRRKARQSQEETPQVQQPEEQYDYIDESSMRTSTQIADNKYLTLVATPSDGDPVAGVTPGDGYEPLDTNTRENNKLYENENGEYTSMSNTTD